MGERWRLPYAELQAPVGHTPRRPGAMRQRELERELSCLDKQWGSSSVFGGNGSPGKQESHPEKQKKKKQNMYDKKREEERT